MDYEPDNLGFLEMEFNFVWPVKRLDESRSTACSRLHNLDITKRICRRAKVWAIKRVSESWSGIR